ncbi:MAG: LacI family DNA-binding transcriptional regulator, partial [Victivallales bacterium]|nr:LacI family DNA-binding transcriptional regulator [Victivallales bacterium]
MPSKRMTLRAIAEMAGVSETTASLCLNGKARQYHISEETCQRIQEVMRRVNYQPNVNARAMALKRTNIIGYVMRGSVGASFWAEILSGIDQALAPDGFHLLPIFIQDTLQAEMEAMDFLVAKGVDACIWVPICSSRGATNAKTVLQNHSKRLPIMTLTHLLNGFHGIEVDDDKGGSLAADYLWDMGHRKIAVFGDDMLYSRSKAC